VAYKRQSAKPVLEGGTGNVAISPYSVICGGSTTTGNLQVVSGTGSSTQVLTSNGASALPSWQNASSGAGSLTLIATLSGNNVNTIQFGSSYVTSTYSNYMMVINNWNYGGTAAPEFLCIDFTDNNWANRIPGGLSGTNSWPYNSSSDSNNYGAANSENYIDLLQGQDQGIGIIYVNLTNFSTYTQATWNGRFSNFNNTVGGQMSYFGGNVASPGFINGMSVVLKFAGFFLNVTVSLYGFKQ